MTWLTWLHLSDLHACPSKSGWDAGRVIESLVKDLRKLQAGYKLRPDLLFFTGDAAFGQIGTARDETLEGQFHYAAEFLHEVRRAFEPEVPLTQVFVVPGNHDVNRQAVSRIDSAWLDDPVRTLKEVQDVLHEGANDWRRLGERLADYRRFLARHWEHLHQLDPGERSLYATVREIAGWKVGIAGFNTTWSSYRDRERGKLWMAGRWQQETFRQQLQEADFSIALLHHPPSWLGTEEEPSFQRGLQQDFRFLLHGHEHQEWPTLIDDLLILSAGACYEGSDGQNGYNLVQLNPQTGKCKVWLRRYELQGGGWEPHLIHGRTDSRGTLSFRLRGWQATPRPRSPRRKSARPPDPTSPADPLLYAILILYLERLRESCRYLPIAGFETRVRLPLRLEEVYIPLRAQIQHQILEKDQQELGARRQLSTSLREEADLPLDQIFSRLRQQGARGAVVLGDPGSGKSTLLKHFVLLCTDLQSGPAALGLPGDTVPVWIELRRLKDARIDLHRALAEVLAQPELALRDRATLLAQHLFDRDGLLILIDGLDEVAEAEDRAAISRWVEEALVQLPRSTFVVTSRYAGYREGARLSGQFLELHLRDLVQGEAERFIADWYAAVETQVEGGRAPEVARHIAEKGAADLQARIFRNEDLRASSLRELAEIPLLLQILCLVHRDHKKLPERRVELYGECVKVLLETWRQAKKLPVDLPALQALKLLQPVAFHLHAAGQREAPLAEILPVLTEPLRDLGRNSAEGEDLLKGIRDQSGLLVFLGQGRYGFLHPSFQEYLCARHLQDRVLREPDLLPAVAQHFGKQWWREVLLLAAGLDNPSLFEPLLKEFLRQGLLHRDPRLADDFLRDASTPTPRPLLTALADVNVPAEEKYHVLRLLRTLPEWKTEGSAVVAALRTHRDPRLQHLAIELLGAPPLQALGRKSPMAGAERIHEKSGMVLVFVPGGTYTLGAEGISLDETPVHGVQLSPFWLGKYPMTNEQYARYLAARPEAPQPLYWKDRRFNHPQQPVVGVSWEDASAYCRWAGLDLPSEAQWEAAARGKDGRRFPWGNEIPTADRANFDRNEGRTTSIGAYPRGSGPFGALDQAGNVWEWCRDPWDPSAYAQRLGEPRDPVSVPIRFPFELRTLRGGAWFSPAESLANAYRHSAPAVSRVGSIGFRCLLAAVPCPTPCCAPSSRP